MDTIYRNNAVRPADLPSPPQTTIPLLQACANEKSSAKSLSRLVECDPLLTAELLRIVNSAYFGLARKVQSVVRAIPIIGVKTLRNLVLCISLRDSIKNDSIPGLDTAVFWEDALRRAICARLLGKASGLDADECFTAGLLQDFGLLVLFYLQPEVANQWMSMRLLDPDQRYQKEKQFFSTTHDQLGLMLARVWALPNSLALAIGYHHLCEQGNFENQGEHVLLCRILHCTDWITSVYSAKDKEPVINHGRTLLQNHFLPQIQSYEAIITTISEEVEEAALAMGLRVTQKVDVTKLLQESNARLAEENLSYQELTWELEKTLNERDRLASELEKELALARLVQRNLLPDNNSRNLPIVGFNIPARELSGDFYDYFVLQDGRIFFNLADVSGKGINAALLMVKASSLFHCLGKTHHSPGVVLKLLNSEFVETSTRGMFVTMIAGLYNPKNNQVRIVNAGHPPALIVTHSGQFTMVESKALPLGVLAEAQFPEEEINLDGNLYLFSDGVTEGYDALGQVVGLQGLKDLIIKYKKLPPKNRLKAIVNEIHCGSATRTDDMTLLLLEGNNGLV